MTPERWAVIGRVFDEAQSVAEEERSAFLDRACAADPALKMEVLSLLDSLRDADRFLETTAVERLVPSIPPRIGPYTILGEIGRGGMGVVLKASRNDQGFERVVAIKLVKRGMDTDFILRRFENERRILAGLDHPNIARVLDGGSAEGVPYFVMELIEGRTILDSCSQLSIRDRLAIFQQVCSAVQYAHQRLVIHRDIKPSNIVVSRDGVPKLLDFGLARVLADDERSERTHTAFRLLTPEYASPEQVRGDELTTATDVYSLGVVLYELLVGTRPYAIRVHTEEEIRRAIVEEMPAKPPSRARIDRDLEAIVMMALRKEPQRRYASVEQLSEDIRRYLDGLPVHAAPESVAYRTRKFVRRHRVGIAAATTVAAILIGATGVSLYEMHVAQIEAVRSQQVSTFLRELFEQAFPRQTLGRVVTATDLVDAGAARVDRELASQPEIQASMLALLGSLYTEGGASSKAEPLLERSLAIRERVLGRDHLDTAETLYFLSRLRGRQGHYAEAKTLAERSLDIRLRAGADRLLPDSFSQLGIAQYRVGDFERAEASFQRAVSVEEKNRGPNLPTYLGNLAAVQIDRDELDDARRALERALDIGVRAKGGVTADLHVSLLNLADIFRREEDFTHARSLLERELASQEQIFGKDHATYELGALGDLYFAMGDHRRAREFLRRAIESGERVLGADHLELAAPLMYYGRLELAEGRPEEALNLFERVLRIRTGVAGGEKSSQVAETLTDIAIAKRLIDGPAASEVVLRRALAIERSALSPKHRQFVVTLTALGQSLLDQGKADEAARVLGDAVEIARVKLPANHSQRRAAETLYARLGQ